MLTFIIIVLVLASLFRRPRYWGFPFMGGWGYRRPPMGRPHGMGWHHGMGGGFKGGPYDRFCRHFNLFPLHGKAFSAMMVSLKGCGGRAAFPEKEQWRTL